MSKFKNKIWYHKYQPKKLSSLKLDEDHIAAFEEYIEDEQIPHLLLYGPAGGGKTTLANILMKKCAGARLILNSSSKDRGVNTIKQKVTDFAASKRKGRLNAIFFDEANGLTPDAQEALKGTMDRFESNCRFIFATNHIHKITPPIYSRCTAFKFDSFPRNELRKYIRKILKKEHVKYNKSQLTDAIDYHYPDIRSIINFIQFCSIGGKLDLSKGMTVIDKPLIKDHLRNGRIDSLRNLMIDKYDYLIVYRYLMNEFITEEFEDPNIRCEAALIITEYLYRDKDITDKEMNLAGCFLELMNLIGVDIEWGIPF